MKKTFLHILLIFFLFYNFNDFCYAQRNKKPTIEEVLPACDSVEKIKKSFEIEGQKNIDAINIIIQIEKPTINTKVPNKYIHLS